MKTIDELLVEALIPKDEQPYTLPENWVWVKMGYITEINMGQSPKGEHTTNDETSYPLIGGPADMGDDYPNIQRFTIKPTKMSKLNDLIVSVRATIGKTNISNAEYCLGRGVAGITPNIMNIHLLRFYFDTIKNYLYEVSTGTTFQQISKKDIENTPFPLMPINEQLKIIKLLNTQLKKISESHRLIEEAKETFELRRAAIIKNIIESKTKNKTYETKKLSEIFSIFGGGTPRKSNSNYWDGKINWFSAKDIKSTYLTDSIDKITQEGVENSSAKLAKKGAIVIVTRSGILQHSLPVAKLLVNATVNQDLKVFYSENQLLNDFLLWYLQANEKRILNEFSKSGTTVNSIEFDRFKNMLIPILPDQDLKEILDLIEQQVDKEEKALDLILIENRIDSLKNSILSKAFKGELGTNDPNDESAIELLKSIFQEKF